MTLHEQIRSACDARDPVGAGKIGNFLRFHCGMTYDQVCEIFCAHGGITPDDFEGLMYEADTREPSCW